MVQFVVLYMPSMRIEVTWSRFVKINLSLHKLSLIHLLYLCSVSLVVISESVLFWLQ